MSAPKVSIIVLNWNGREDTLECLESLRAVAYPCFDVMVVDNGSHDGSVAAIRQRFPNVDVTETGENLGYAGGNNVGIKLALSRGAQFVLLLNNDTTVDRQLVGQLVAAADAAADGAFFCPKIYFYAEPTKIWYAGGRWLTTKSRFSHIGYRKEDTGQAFSTMREIDYACGCALFARSSAIKRIGLLDEKFFLTFEETDWCYRAGEAGYKSFFVPQAKVWHKVSVSFGGGASPLAHYFMTRNRLLWGRKHLSAREFVRLCQAMYGELLPRLVLDAQPGISYPKQLYWGLAQYRRELQKRLATKEFKACLYGIRDFALGRFGYQEATIRKLK